MLIQYRVFFCQPSDGTLYHVVFFYFHLYVDFVGVVFAMQHVLYAAQRLNNGTSSGQCFGFSFGSLLLSCHCFWPLAVVVAFVALKRL